MINIGVIGCGHWGPNHVRNFSSLPNSRVLMCCDLDAGRLKAVSQLYQSIETTNSYKDILRDNRIGAVIIATPTVTHFEIAKRALEAGKDVLCEKPLSATSEEAEELVELANKRRRILMVGHVFLFNSGINNLKEGIKKRRFGRLLYMHSKRTNLGPFRDDVNVVWDLASHDISVFNYLLNSMPKEATASGGKYLKMNFEDVSFISLVYPKDILVNIHVSWLDPKKVRQITIVGDKKMVIWDDLDMVGPVKLYDRRINMEKYYNGFGEFQLLAKEGNIVIPKISLHEPLREQSKHFIMCVTKRNRPIPDGESGAKVVRVLEAVQGSLAGGGMPVRITGGV